MARKPRVAAPEAMPGDLVSVTVTVADAVSTGKAADTYDVGAEINVTPEQAESLRAQGFAE